MDNSKKIDIQEPYKANLDDNFIASLDLQTDFEPTKPLLHKESRFLFITSGLAKIKIQNEIHIMKPDRIIALLPWQISEIIEVEEPVSYYLLIYKFDMINTVIKRTLNIDDEDINMIDTLYSNNSIDIPQDDVYKVRNFFIDMRNELGIRSLDIDLSRKDFSSTYVVAKLTELLVYYMRLCKNSDMKNEPMLSEEIFKYMYLNSGADLSIGKLSKMFLMSESTISKYITSMTGLGFYDLLNEMRLSKAQFLLLHTDLNLEDIAKILNFSDPSQLSKIFSSNYGIGTKRFKSINKEIKSLTNLRFDENTTKIIEYIYDNYGEDIDILDISSVFNIPPRNINKILKYYVEQNFTNFLNTIRVNKASELLIKTDLPITDIAIMVGFNSTKTFTRNFYKFFSMNPSKFREKNITIQSAELQKHSS